MPKIIWEYHIEVENSWPSPAMLKRLNELGAEGWEHYDRYMNHLIFKRKIEKPDD